MFLGLDTHTHTNICNQRRVCFFLSVYVPVWIDSHRRTAGPYAQQHASLNFKHDCSDDWYTVQGILLCYDLKC